MRVQRCSTWALTLAAYDAETYMRAPGQEKGPPPKRVGPAKINFGEALNNWHGVEGGVAQRGFGVPSGGERQRRYKYCCIFAIDCAKGRKGE